jgi:poly(A) polymerase
VTIRREAAERIVERLRAEGYQAYFAGGCVRDLLLGLAPKDFDVATNAQPEVVLEMFPTTFAVGAHFGVVLVADQDSDNQEFVTEVATFRNDGAYSDGRHPDAVRFSESAEEDVKRRDFTINGMLLDPVKLDETGEVNSAVLDFVGGRDDLAAGLVRAIGDPRLRFEEDKLRMLRAVRFAARFGFAIEERTAAAIRALAAKVDQVSRERVRDELTRMLTEGHAHRAFELLDSTGLLVEVLPEVAKMHGVEQPPQFHPEGDVWVHTLLLLEKLPADASAALAWGALLHDVGKPPTFRPAPVEKTQVSESRPGAPESVTPGRIRFDGHVEVGVRIAEEILKRLRFSSDDTSQILLLIENHMRFGDVPRMKESTLKRFFRLPNFEEHLALHRMDVLSSFGDLGNYEFAKEHYETIPIAEVRPQLLVTGRDLIAAGHRPGPRFKEMLALAEDAQLEGQIGTLEEGLTLIREKFAGETA